MKPQGKSIYNFTPGDLITRVTSSNPKNNGSQDPSYIGMPFYFLGIANGCIYLDPKIDGDEEIAFELMMEKMLFGKVGKKQLNLDLWENGWDLYVDPATFIPYSKNETLIEEESTLDNTYNYSVAKLKQLYDNAIIKEQYELADKYKKMLGKKDGNTK